MLHSKILNTGNVFQNKWLFSVFMVSDFINTSENNKSCGGFLSIRHISMLKTTFSDAKYVYCLITGPGFRHYLSWRKSVVVTWLPCNSGHCSKIPSMARNSPSCDIIGMSSHWRHRQSNVCLINRAPKCLFWKQEIVIKKINFMGFDLI